MSDPRDIDASPAEPRKVRLWVPWLAAVAIPVVIFGLWELVERSLLAPRLTMDTLHLLHTVRGIGTALLVAAVVSWYLLRQRDPAFPAAPSADEARRLLERDERLRLHTLWFVQMRWLAVGVTLALIAIAVPIARLLPRATLLPLLGWTGLLVVANLFFWRWVERGELFERQIATQAAVDLVILTGLLNASGGIENPLYIVYLFHVIIPGILLPRRKALGLAAVAASLFTALAIGEYLHLLPHYTNVLFPHGIELGRMEAHEDAGHDGDLHQHASHDLVFVAGRTVPFLVVLFLTFHFTTLVAERLRRSEVNLAREAWQALMEHQRLESVVRAARVGMMLVAPDVTIRWFSPRTAEWLGWDAGVLEQRCPLDGAPGGCETCIAARTLASGRPLESERRTVGERGAVRYFRHATSPVRDQGGRIVQVVELVEDITARKALEAEALHAGKLSALGRMAAGIAHEIGNPLSSLATRLHLMERRQDPEFLRESVGVLRTQLSRIGRIVQGVSQFGRSGEGGWTVWELNQAAREALSLVELDRRARGVAFRKRLASPSPWVRGVRDQMVQVVLNLLLNAVEVTAEGGEVTIETSLQEGTARLVVADTGPGLDETTRRRLFEPFFTTKAQGTGLGLSISYGLVHAHGGRIEVESGPGRGSRFAVCLPAAEAEEVEEPARTPREGREG